MKYYISDFYMALTNMLYVMRTASAYNRRYDNMELGEMVTKNYLRQLRINAEKARST